MKATRFIATLLLGMPMVLPALAQPASAPAPDAGEVQSVFVAGTRDPDWKSYRAFVAGMKVFEEKHALAPSADLRFVLRPRRTHVQTSGLQMHIEAEGIKIPVPIGDDGTFTLPYDEAAAEKGAEIMLSKRRNLLSWRPLIQSPGVPANARRMGDLRLECAVRWAVEKGDLIALFRVTINAFGGPCDTPAVKVDYISNRALAAVYMVSGDRREKLNPKWIEENGHIYLPPLHDASWTDDALVEFEYQP